MNGSKHNDCIDSLIIVLVAWMWIYTPYMGGYHHMDAIYDDGLFKN
jgi:hypothetical protein